MPKIDMDASAKNYSLIAMLIDCGGGQDDSNIQNISPNAVCQDITITGDEDVF